MTRIFGEMTPWRALRSQGRRSAVEGALSHFNINYYPYYLLIRLVLVEEKLIGIGRPIGPPLGDTNLRYPNTFARPTRRAERGGNEVPTY
jgi:hypothetical protein